MIYYKNKTERNIQEDNVEDLFWCRNKESSRI